MKIKCIVKGCENHKNEGGFEDGMCLPCYLFITTGEGVYSQAYRNTHPPELTDEEISGFLYAYCIDMGDVYEASETKLIECVRAILRKAQEK